MSRNQELFDRSQRLIPGGVNSPVRAFGAVGGVPRFFQRGEGATVYDADGKAYIDYVCSWGPLLHGHAHPDVLAAVESTMKIGFSFGAPTEAEISDLVFANKCVKHLKSNAIALAHNKQLIGIGCGQTSRVDSMRHAIEKARRFGFDPKGSVMASDAFFPFPDSVELAHEAGVTAVVQPGGSIRDQDSIDVCDANGMAMVITGIRHFKH